MLREAGADFAFIRTFKAGANDLRRRVAQLFTFNDDENSAIAYVLISASIMYVLTNRLKAGMTSLIIPRNRREI